MKPQTKLIIALIVLLLITLAIASVLIYGKDKKIHSLQQANGVLTNEVTTYKHVNGKLLADNQAAEVRAKDFEKALPQLADALTRQMDIKLRNFRAGVVASIEARGSGNASITPIDTAELTVIDEMPHFGQPNTLGDKFEPFALTFDDGYLSFKSDVYSELNAPSEYVYGDTIKFAFSMKRPKRFHQKQLFVSGSLSNPNAKVIRSEGVLVNEFKQKRFGIGPSIGYALMMSPGGELHHGYTIGLTLNWNVIRF